MRPLLAGDRLAELRMPLLGGHDAGDDPLQAREEAGEPVPAAQVHRAMTGMTGARATNRLPGSSSTGWSSLPPGNQSYLRAGCGSPVSIGTGASVPVFRFSAVISPVPSGS
ncbi:putative protein OS=Streptomyces griseomycini OX=66895 GN=FHS37_001606 PE=4 SV=1 [Streptomyces griseomycini]|uniref:Uncharacterized protein n=1 Tax=Streptomyces griseomycini TaxID=66895 RepID=A0A7W7LW68_9ACTN|nr:hypothetical protein [Streptomyces griseomycini]GGR12809.1 hypothetical protein GCM10015536_18140 [Streptomyces griseomycini]